MITMKWYLNIEVIKWVGSVAEWKSPPKTKDNSPLIEKFYRIQLCLNHLLSWYKNLSCIYQKSHSLCYKISNSIILKEYIKKIYTFN